MSSNNEDTELTKNGKLMLGFAVVCFVISGIAAVIIFGGFV
jgi:hypothetical protein